RTATARGRLHDPSAAGRQRTHGARRHPGGRTMKRTLGLLLLLVLLPGTSSAFTGPSTPTFQLKWGTTGSAPGQFNLCYGAAVDAYGDVYIADSANQRIQKFDRFGNFILQWGSSGTGDGQFNYPDFIALDSAGNVYVSDYFNDRVQKFT